MPTPDPQLTQARDAESRGDFRAAAALYRQFLQRNPDAAETHAALAILLARTGQPRPALPHLEKATRLEPSKPEHHHALGLLYASLSRLDDALAEHDKARSLDPNHAEAHVDAALLLEMRGSRDEALRAVSLALAADPNDQRARILDARLGFRAGATDPDTLDRYRADLRTIAAHADNPVNRALALDILVDVCERLERFDDAWAAITQCNEADRIITGRALPTPQQRDARFGLIDTLARFMTPDRARAWRDQCPGDALPSPALLIGFPRSGTTMTERALDAHPNLTSLEEQPTFSAAERALPQIVPRNILGANRGPELLDALTPDQVGRLRQAYWQSVCRLLNTPKPPADTLILDKLPLRITELPFVARLFPDAKILVAIRDPRDVCLSCIRQRFGYAGNIAISAFLDPHDTARLYAHAMNAWLTTKDAYVNPTMEIRYEQTVADFENRIHAMLGFLGLPWDDAVLSFHRRTDRLHNTPSYHAVTQEVSTRAVGRWKRYESHLAPILPTLQPFITALGYE